MSVIGALVTILVGVIVSVTAGTYLARLLPAAHQSHQDGPSAARVVQVMPLPTRWAAGLTRGSGELV